MKFEVALKVRLAMQRTVAREAESIIIKTAFY
jgi:hypothetical protein